MNNKLIQLLKTFPSKEFTAFGKFVNSPFHNESKLLIKLYAGLAEHYPHFNGGLLNKKNIFREMYGRGEFNDKKLRDRLSDMLKLAEEYLAITHLKKNRPVFKIQTLAEFSERGLAVHFDKKYSEVKTLLDKIKVKNEKSIYDEYILEGERMNFYENKQLLGKRKSFFDEISVHMEQFLRYFATTMLRYYSIMNNIKGVMNYKPDYKLYEVVMKYIDQNNFENYPLVRALRLIIKINENFEDINSYFELKELYLKNHVSMDIYDKVMVCTELYIHSGIRSWKKIVGFETEQFEILKLQLEHGTYPREKGWMKREQFLVTVDTAILHGRLDWAKKFIADYSVKVVPELRENAQLWAKGFLYFSDKKYDLALREFQKIKLGDHFYYYRVKVPVSQIYYEMNEHESLFTIIDSMKHYTSSNPLVPERVKEWNSKYINFLQRLVLLANNYDDFKVSKLIESIEKASTRNVAAKSWLLKKAMELRQKN